MLGDMELRIQPEKGKERVVDATPEAIESALREMGELLFIVCSDEENERYMQDDGSQLEYGEYPEGGVKLYRASAGSVRLHGARPAFLSFLAGTDEWRELYQWEDVTGELPTVWGQRLRRAAVVAVLLVVLGFVLWRVGFFS
jgi:hypothetical protein